MATHESTLSGATVPTTAITAQRVEDSDRLMTLLSIHFGQHVIEFENTVYDLMSRVARDYRGAVWRFYELSNRGLYMAPRYEGTFRFVVDKDRYLGQMSADGAGITVCLFAYKLLSFRHAGDDPFGDHFHRLKEFAMQHPEAVEIFAAID